MTRVQSVCGGGTEHRVMAVTGGINYLAIVERQMAERLLCLASGGVLKLNQEFL